MQKILSAISLILASGNCYAITACPNGSRPCASVAQVLLYVVLPTIGFFALGLICKVKIQNNLLRKGSLAFVGITWIIWLFVVLSAFGAFLAPCSSACWYGFSN